MGAIAETATTARDDAVLRVEGLTKTYGGVAALAEVSLEVRRGTIHGLLGENGAGKSTPVGLISGQRRPSAGRILLDGRPVEGSDLRAMEQAGVFLVTQEPMIVDQLSAAENLMLGVWPSRRGFVDRRAMRREAARIPEGTGIAPDAPAGRLDAVSRRKLNILRAMSSGGKVVILDEPTTALTAEDRRTLFDFMRRLKGEGVTFVFISHYDDEILDVCDAVSVLRDGRLAGGSEDIGAMTSQGLSELVLGRGLVLFERERRRAADGPGIRISDVRSGALRVDRLDLRPGEILGFTGLPGAGAKELARCLFGLAPGRGRIRLGEAPERRLPRDPAEALGMGIAYLSDDRRRDGLVGPMAIGQNIAMSSMGRVSRRGLRPAAEAELVRRQFDGLGVKAAGPAAAVDTLSGGNQQKVCLGRVIATGPRLPILDEPTRGIDVGVKQEVLRTIDGLTRDGVCVILVSTDTDELVRAADRVCLFADGSVVETVEGCAITGGRLRAHAGGGSAPRADGGSTT